MSIVRVLLFFILLSCGAFPRESGWLEVEKHGIVVYKPFVKLHKREKGCFVLFVTPQGKVYKGKLSKKSLTAVPRKSFPDKNTELIYLIFCSPSPFEVNLVSTGKVEDR